MVKPVVSNSIFCMEEIYTKAIFTCWEPPCKFSQQSLIKFPKLSESQSTLFERPTQRSPSNRRRIRPLIRFWIPPKAPYNSIQLFIKPLGELEDRHGVGGYGLNHRFDKSSTACPRQILAFPTIELVLNPLLNVVKVLFPMGGEE